MAKVRIQKVVPTTLLGAALVIFGVMSWELKDIFLSRYDSNTYEMLYTLSQFGYGKKVISDDELYAYAGHEYITTGDISDINTEHPPLGKYLIGLSIVFFGNQNVVNLLYGLLLLYLSWQLAKMLLESMFSQKLTQIVAPFVPLILVIEPAFWNNVTHSFLDLPQALLLLFFILLAIKNATSLDTNNDIFLGIVLGLLASVKYPAMAVLLFGSYLTSWLLSKRRRKGDSYLTILRVGGVSVVVFLLMYSPLIVTKGGGALITVFGKITQIHLSHVPDYPPGALLRVLFTNQWLRWFEPWGYQRAPYWNWTWPVLGTAFILSPLLFISYFRQKSNFWIVFIFSWLYFGFLASRLFFPNYFFPLMPLGFTFSFSLLVSLWQYGSKKFRQRNK